MQVKKNLRRRVDPLSTIISVRIPKEMIDEMDGQINKGKYRSRKEILLKAIKNYNGERCRVPHGNKKLTSFKLNKGILKKIEAHVGIGRSRSKVIREALAQLLAAEKQPREKPIEILSHK